jgi:hypothetical protein
MSGAAINVFVNSSLKDAHKGLVFDRIGEAKP